MRVASASLDPREGNLRKSRQLVALPYVPIFSYRSFLALTDGDFTRCDAARPKISKLHARLPSPRLSRTPYTCVACPHSPRKHPTMPCYLPASRSVNHSKCAPSAPWASMICIRAEAHRWLRPGKRLPRRKWGLSGARAYVRIQPPRILLLLTMSLSSLSFPMPSHTLTLT